MQSRWFAALPSMALTIGGAASSHAASPTSVEVGDATVVIADVAAVDKADRTVTLAGPNGNAVIEAALLSCNILVK
jgi:hypothetical protein